MKNRIADISCEESILEGMTRDEVKCYLRRESIVIIGEDFDKSRIRGPYVE